jgi:hypothetical protein
MQLRNDSTGLTHCYTLVYIRAMSFLPHIEVSDKYLKVTHEPSPAGNTETQNFAAELAEICDRENIHRVLLDERPLTYTVGDVFDLMGIGDKLVEEMLVFRFHRLACVTTPEQMEIVRRFESVARNRGLNYRAFENIADAERWLLEE